MAKAPKAVVALQLLYVALAFGWRTLWQWRRTGDTGFRLSRRSPAKDRAASLLMTAGAAVGFLATARAGRRATGLSRATGWGLMVAGLAGTLRAQVEMGRSWRVGVDAEERTDLVTEGLFTMSRNPIFTCMVAVACGTALAVPTAGTALGAALLFAGIEAQVRLVEEPYLLRVHGERYRDYGRRTGRFLPTAGRWR